MTMNRCQHCEAKFDHPNVKECASIVGKCEHLVRAGWKPVWIHVSLETYDGRHIFSKGGWICPNCSAEFVPARPAHKRRVRRRNHRNHDRELS